MAGLINFKGLQAKTVGALSLLLILLIAGLIAMNLVDLNQTSSDEVKASSTMLADSVYNGILHPMAINDTETIRKQMQAYGANMKQVQVLIFAFDHKVTYASHKKQIKGDLRTILVSEDLKAALSNLFASGKLDRSDFDEESEDKNLFTIVKPMLNEKRCHHCHGASRKVLGGVMVRRDITALMAHQDSLFTRNIIVAVVGILVSIGLVWLLLSVLVIKPLGGLVGAARYLASGDLTHRLRLGKKDELGNLADSMDQVSDSLGKVIQDVESKAENLADGVSQQAAAIEETAASTEEIASMLQKNAENAGEAQTLVDQTIQGMQGARESMRTLSGNMADTSAASDDVAKIIKSIDEIAFQTNLLALNAAVEAARAGEAGAGFAVVADEVRNLAIRAAGAAEQTEELISDIVSKIKESHQLVEHADEEYREVAMNVQKVSALSEEIAGASQEQANGIAQVNSAMSTIDNVTQQQSAMAHDLAEIMGRFKVGGGAAKAKKAPAPQAQAAPPKIEYQPKAKDDDDDFMDF